MGGFSGHNLAFAFGLLGNIISFFVFLSPLPTFYQIYKKKSTEGFQCVPYTVALFSAMLLMYYAFLKTNATLLITINSFGCLIETIYIGVFIFYAPKKLPTVKLLVSMMGAFGLILITTHFFAKGSMCVRVVGWICLLFSVSVFAAPLCILKQVIQTKSVEFMPFSLSCSLTLNAVMWFFYGLLINDYNIAIPNVLGFFFGIVQMVLYAFYKNKTKKIMEEKIQPAEQLKNQVIIELEEEKKQPADQLAKHVIDVEAKIPNVLGFLFGVVQMVLNAFYKNQKKKVMEEKIKPAEKPKNQVIIELEEEKKQPELTEHVIDVEAKLKEIVCRETVPMVLFPNGCGITGDFPPARPSMEISVSV